MFKNIMSYINFIISLLVTTVLILIISSYLLYHLTDVNIYTIDENKNISQVLVVKPVIFSELEVNDEIVYLSCDGVFKEGSIQVIYHENDTLVINDQDGTYLKETDIKGKVEYEREYSTRLIRLLRFIYDKKSLIFISVILLLILINDFIR